MRYRPGTAYQAFLTLVPVPTDECILWPFSINTGGYGAIWHQGRKQRVSNLACRWQYGAPPTPSHVAAHSCRNRHCFNPRHLRWATVKENSADMHRDGTSTRGSRSPMAKLTDVDVLEIRQSVRLGETHTSLARKYGVSRPNVSMIVSGVTWGHLPLC